MHTIPPYKEAGTIVHLHSVRGLAGLNKAIWVQSDQDKLVVT